MRLTSEEQEVTQRVDKYFVSPRMSLKDKIFSAKLIALHELELENFSGEVERQKIAYYTSILDRIMEKLKADTG